MATQKSKTRFNLILNDIDDIINEKIPSSTLKTIGHAFKEFTTDDILEIGSTILKEDLSPFFKDLKVNASLLKDKSISTLRYLSSFGTKLKREGLKSVINDLKSETTISENYQESIILIPETKKRLNEFMHNVSRDYSLLQTDEERGAYILKLSAFTSLFFIAFQSGLNLTKDGQQRSFISKVLLPTLMMNGSLTLINRILEQAEKKIEHDQEAIIVTHEIRKFIKIVNTGIGSGMTLQAIAEGLTQTKITPKGKVDALIHSTVLALFSKDIPDKPEQ